MKVVGRRKLKRCRQNDAKRELDTILEAIYEDILITDGQGKILKVSKSFEDVYGVSNEYILQKTVYEMEEEGVFRPSVIARVIESNEHVTMRQKNSKGKELVVTAVPIKNEHGDIVKVVSFTRDITDYLNLQKQYSELESIVEKYSAEIEELRSKAISIDGVVGNSDKIREIIKVIDKIARFDANVLFLGPSGVGKTMFARILHSRSSRSSGPFIEINCAAIPHNLLESELFGYEKGSFTGAGASGKIGLIELAQGGTLMLDEISELPLSLQAKILKVIQDKTITRVGGTIEIKVDFRLITASNRDMEELISQDKFRRDLYYRLNVVTIYIPALESRKEDILPLTAYFIDKFNEKHQLNKTIHPQAMNLLMRYNWPGNVRELENVLEYAVITSAEDVITMESLPESILNPLGSQNLSRRWSSLTEAMEEYEGMIIRETFKLHNTTVNLAKALQISQPTAVRKIKKYIY